MKKFPFTPEGVAALCHHLYQLNDNELAIEAAALAADFKQWVLKHLILSPEQETYLDELHLEVKRFLSFQASFAIGHRLPIVLNKPTNSGIRASKLFKPKAKMAVTVLPDQNYTAEGVLELNISY